jgi:3-hydroxybutyryl-CoA dehydrogenase
VFAWLRRHVLYRLTDQSTEEDRVEERLAIVGSGAIACGLAATAARHRDVVVWVRSPGSAERARATVDAVSGRLTGAVNARHVHIATDLGELSEATFLVEAIIEDRRAKTDVLASLGDVAGSGAIVATTTSSLSIAELAEASGMPERFAGLHVFNPVPRMKLVELAFPAQATAATRRRTRALCEALGKTPVEVPDTPGFVVNRLLFPYLFSAVELMESTGLAPADVDACITLGAGHPMGPLALLDFVGLDVAVAIGETIGANVPERLRALVAEGALGRKTGRGLYEH